MFERDYNLSDLDNADYGKLNSSSNSVMLWENADKKIHPWTVMLWNMDQGAYYTTQIY